MNKSAYKNIYDVISEKKHKKLDPVGKEDRDIDNDGDSDSTDSYLLNRRRVRSSIIKPKTTKESYSNWKEELSEIVEITKKDKNESKITGKGVKNNKRIKINPSISEAVNNLGGTLLEMIEVDEFDYIVESVYDELLEDGYDEEDIEESIEYALNEAKITYGHDTAPKETEKKRVGLLSAAKERLSNLKKQAKQAVATGARKVARGALGVARKVEGDKSKPSSAHLKRGSSKPYSGEGVGRKERVSSGSYQAPPTKKTQKKAEPIEDPWSGSHTTPKKKSEPEKPAAKTKTTKVSSDIEARRRSAALRATRRNPNISKDDLQKIVDSIKENTYSDYVNMIKEFVAERKMTAAERAKEERLGKKTKSALTAMKKQYGSEKGTQVYYAWKRKKAMSEESIDEAKLPRSERKPKTQRTSKTHVIHDVDDNLADQRSKDAAKIDVMRKTGSEWKKVKSLTPSQFAHYNLRKPGEPVKESNDDPGDKYGFDEFRSTKKFKETTKPVKPVARLGGKKAKKSVVTARGGSPFGSTKPSTPMDNSGEFAKDLSNRIGVKGLKRGNVHFTGGMKTGSGPEKKAKIVKQIVKPDAKKVITTDDHLQNVRHMASAAASAAPSAKVRAYQSRPATKASGKTKVGDIVPTRVGKERDLESPNIGIRSGADKPKTTKEKQRARKRAMREELIARMQEKISEQALEMQPKNQEKLQQEKKPQTSQIRNALTAIERESEAEKQKSRALRRLAQSGGDVSSVTK